MNFDLNDDQLAFVETARSFAKAELEPYAGEWDATSHFPVPVIKKTAALGFAALYCNEKHGGTGLGRLDSSLIFEELSRGCIPTAAYISIHNMVTWMVDSFANEDQKKRFMPDLVSMKKLASYCLTESASGSDAGSLKTKAIKKDGYYEITGSKAFISGAGVSDLYLVMARTGDDTAKGISCFIIEKDMKGVSFGAPERKMGWKSQPTATVNLDAVKVPLENLIGDEGHGFKFAMAGLDGGRVNIASCSLGGAQAALDKAVAYMSERKQFGKSLNEFQALQFRVADMVTNLEAARLMVRRAAHAIDVNAPNKSQLCAMAKRFATDAAFDIANQALQLHGGYGYVHEYGVERIVRDLRVHQILEGTNEIMRVIIAKHVLA